jgi:hypothetical protein
MVADQPFTHPHLGIETRLERDGCEVRLVFVAHSGKQASDLADLILDQLKAGGLNMEVTGKPITVPEE